MTPDFILRKRIQMMKSLSKKLFELIYECKSILRKVFKAKQLEERLSIQTYIFKKIVGSKKIILKYVPSSMILHVVIQLYSYVDGVYCCK